MPKRFAFLALLLFASSATAADEPWLTYRVFHAELAHRDPRPQVALYPDGRVEVSRAAWQPRSGVYEYRLDADELDAVVALATAPALAATDLAATELAIADTARRLDRDEGVIHALLDGDSYHVTIVNAAAPGSRSPASGTVELVWTMIHPALEAAAALPARARLETLRERLESLADTTGAARIADAVAIEETRR